MSNNHRPRRERLSEVDNAWLRMEQPTNLMMITGVLVFDRPLDFQRLQWVYQQRLLRYRRFRQRVSRSLRGNYWEDDPDFDLRRHLRRRALPGAAGKAELEELASDLRSTPLDFSKPLWQADYIENYQSGSALIVRLHHCIADGIAMIYVLLSMADDAEHGAMTPERAAPRPQRDVLGGLFAPVSETVDEVLRLVRRTLLGGGRMLLQPGRWTHYLGQGVGAARELSNLALLPPDPDTLFQARPGVTKRVAWAEPLPLDEVKAVSKALGCSVNDVLLSAVSGALGHYLIFEGELVEADLCLRAAVPVNLRPLEDAHKLGNYFGLVLLELPVGEPNPLARLYRLHRTMADLKRSLQPAVTFGLLHTLGLVPAALQLPTLNFLSRRASAVMTNVPGPQEALYLAGGKISEIMFWVPSAGEVTMGVSILSYNGQVHFGLTVDERTVADPDALLARFAVEFEQLALIALLGGDQPPEPQDFALRHGLPARAHNPMEET